LDNIRENASIERDCRERFLGIKFELIGLRRTHMSRKVKRKIQALYLCIMLDDAGIMDEMRRGTWAECASKATFCASIFLIVIP
jgi:hypothetical protein